jgi:hypothetical protein
MDIQVSILSICWQKVSQSPPLTPGLKKAYTEIRSITYDKHVYRDQMSSWLYI